MAKTRRRSINGLFSPFAFGSLKHRKTITSCPWWTPCSTPRPHKVIFSYSIEKIEASKYPSYLFVAWLCSPEATAAPDLPFVAVAVAVAAFVPDGPTKTPASDATSWTTNRTWTADKQFRGRLPRRRQDRRKGFCLSMPDSSPPRIVLLSPTMSAQFTSEAIIWNCGWCDSTGAVGSIHLRFPSPPSVFASPPSPPPPPFPPLAARRIIRRISSCCLRRRRAFDSL